MKFSFIIINYQTPDLTCQCLDSIFKYFSGDLEIILLDNASSDDSIYIIENKLSGKIKFIKNKSNLGFAKANNFGAKIAKGDILFFLNSDTLMVEDLSKSIENFFDTNKNLGIISPELFVDDKTPQKKAYGHFPKLRDLLLKNLRITKETNKKEDIDWISGAALVIKKDIFNKVGGWDENFFMYMEDICWRVKKLGYGVALCPNTKIIHLGGRSMDKNFQRRKYYFKSQDYFFKKHHGYFSMILLKILRWPYEIMVWFNELRRSND
jgi:hypothetical protein